MLYFHGNAEDLGLAYSWLNVYKEILGLRVVAMEYRGYGLYGSKAKCAEKLLQDALKVYDFIRDEMCVDEQDILLFGRSLGCAAATSIASQRSPGSLILMSPFKTLQSAAKAIVGNFLGSLVVEKLDNQTMIKRVTAPVFILHG
jgi:pimeloyl-ACP methyl ester carboxylesterase